MNKDTVGIYAVVLGINRKPSWLAQQTGKFPKLGVRLS